jgi:hypothetical protein
MSYRLIAVSFGLALLATGCGGRADESADPSEQESPSIEGGQTGGETPPLCTDTTPVRPLGLTDPSPRGYSAQDVLNGVDATTSHTAMLIWRDTNMATTLDASLSYRNFSGYAESCKQNEIDVLLLLTSADGALNESIAAKAFAASPNSLTIDLDLPVATLRGAFSSRGALRQQALTLTLRLALSAGKLTGTIATTSSNAQVTSLASF